MLTVALAFCVIQCGGPAPIPTACLQLWLKADAGVELNGRTVSRWVDQSGNENDANQLDARYQPLSVSKGLNGFPVLRFDGVDDWLRLTGSVRMSDLSVFAVFKLDSGAIGADYYVPIVFGNENNAGQFYGLGTETRFLSSAPDTLNVFAGPNSAARAVAHNCVAYGQWKNLNVVTSGTIWNTTVRVNGLAASILTDGVNMLLSVPLGNSLAGGLGGMGVTDRVAGSPLNRRYIAKCDIAELIVYDKALSDSARQSIERYLAVKYHLPPGP